MISCLFKRKGSPLLLGKRDIDPKPVRTVDPMILMALLLLYYLARFFLGGIALPLLFLFALPLLSVVGRRTLCKSPFACQLFPLLLFLFSIPIALMAANKIAATYFVFLLVLFWIRATSPSAFAFKNEKVFRICVVLFIVVATIFLLFPGLQSFSSYVIAAKDVMGQIYLDEIVERPRAFFFHPGEFGVVAASVAMLVLAFMKQTSKGGPFLKGDMLLFAALTLLVYLSHATTAYVMLFFATLFYTRFRKQAAFGMVLLFAFQVLSQFFFAHEVAVYIQKGSLWWRYTMVGGVMDTAPLLRFAPALVNTLSNWSHSLLADIALCFGKASAFLFVLLQLALFIPKNMRWAGIFNLLFLSVSFISPSGAGPALFLLALAANVCAASFDETAQDKRGLSKC